MTLRDEVAIDPGERTTIVQSRLEVLFRKAFREAVRASTRGLTDADIARLINENRTEDLLVGLEIGADLLASEYAQSVALSATATATFLSGKLVQPIRYDPLAPKSTEVVRIQQARIRENFITEQRAVVQGAISHELENLELPPPRPPIDVIVETPRQSRTTLNRGFGLPGDRPTRGRPGFLVRRTTRDILDGTRVLGPGGGLSERAAGTIRQSLGLTNYQSNAVRRYELALRSLPDRDAASNALGRALSGKDADATIRRAASQGRPLTNAEINRATGKYRENYRQYRARVIARTETHRAAMQGWELMYEQAIDQNRIHPQQIRRTWRTAGDERVRESHRALDGLERGVGETFPARGSPLAYPGDPAGAASEVIQCRCVLEAVMIRDAASQPLVA